MNDNTATKTANPYPCENCVFCTGINRKDSKHIYAICSPNAWMGGVKSIQLMPKENNGHCPRFSGKR